MTRPSFDDAPYAGWISFGRTGMRQASPARHDVSILGLPFDGTASYRSGSRFGPRSIREESLTLWGYNNVLQVAPFEVLNIVDLGDVDVVPFDVLATHQSIETAAAQVLDSGSCLISLGGDHSITLPLLRRHAKKHGPMAVIHLDAHPDTWDEEYPGHKYSHGTSFRRAIEESLIDTSAYLQIGIRGSTTGPEDYRQARELGARMITLDMFHQRGLSAVCEEIRQCVGSKATYVSLDIDVVDPAYAPGTGTPEPGGLTSYEILKLVRSLSGLNLVGFDLVEVSPPCDSAQITSILAANLVFEFLSLLAVKKQSKDHPGSFCPEH